MPDMTLCINFNPHSHEGSDFTQYQLYNILGIFQSTLPRRERRSLERANSNISLFQSTLPRRERQPQQSVQDNSLIISIHTPTKGATAILTNNFLIFCSISLINFILYLQIIQILFIFRYKFIFYFIF